MKKKEEEKKRKDMNDWLRGKTVRLRMSFSPSVSLSVSVYVPIGNVSFGINGSRFTARVAIALYDVRWVSFIFQHVQHLSLKNTGNALTVYD